MKPKISLAYMLKILGIVGSTVMITSGVLAAYYGGQAQMTEFVEEKEDILRNYSDASIDRLENKIDPKLNKILNSINKQSEDIAKIKGKLDID